MKHSPRKKEDASKEVKYGNDKSAVKRVLLLGLDEGFAETVKAPEKVMVRDYDLKGISRFCQDTDLLIVNFERGKRPRKNIFLMGVAHASETPIIMCTANPIIYPPLAGLARRIFAGSERFGILRDYLRQITSNDVNSEAKVMYELFRKYNS